MANTLETTFKSLQSDERYKKLERTLKMALLRNAERRTTDNGSTGQWPNVSSINGDHLDVSLAATSVQSSRIGSEVVSSSTNLRNILLHKQHFDGSRNNAATSSENQFPTDKDDNDRVMMPPPSIPGVGGKRFSSGSHRAPLVNMATNSGLNANGFSIYTPASSISSIAKCASSTGVDSRMVYQERDNSHARSRYAEAACNGKKQERSFDKWRVLLNEKGLLIIKGTLECGKVARSKPVIRRLTPTSVQSIFKHTYHLQGNLVDDRGELPDYVRGKFYNGFPDDWENVYQVWRNFVNDGNRLSFRWPTPMTDSDDDIKSEITDISYRPGRPKKSVSPQKRGRSARTSFGRDLSVGDNENRPDSKSCSRSSNVSVAETIERSVVGNHPLTEISHSSHSNISRSKESSKENLTFDDNRKSHDCSSVNSIEAEKNNNSFAGIISEDKLNRIIDNLTNKHCPIEYINKIVEMFDCMKYIVSYHSSVENGSEKKTPDFRGNEASRGSAKKRRSNEEKSDAADTSSSKNLADIARSSKPAMGRYGNQLTPVDADSPFNEESSKGSVRRSRRKLTKRDYESSESGNDSYDDDRRPSTHRFVASYERLGKSPKYNNSGGSVVSSRTSRNRAEPQKSPDRPHRQRIESIAAGSERRHDSSISDEEFSAERKLDPNSENDRPFAGPKRIVGPEMQNRLTVKNYDSSISFTDDDGRYGDKPKSSAIGRDNYDSSVSITEDEHGDVSGRNRINTRKYNVEQKTFSSKPEIRRNANSHDSGNRTNDPNYYPGSNHRSPDDRAIENGDNRVVKKRLDSLDYYSESKSRHAEPNIVRNVENRDIEKRPDLLNYHRDSNSHAVERHVVTNEDEFDDRKRSDSSKFHGETNSCRNGNNMNKNTPQRNFRAPKKTSVFPILPNADDNRDCANTHSSNVEVQGVSACSNFNRANEEDTVYPSSDIKRIAKKVNGNRARTEIQSESEQSSPEIREKPLRKNRAPLPKEKPLVISTETVDVDREWYQPRGGKEIQTNAGNSSRNYADGPKATTSHVAETDFIGQKSPVNTKNSVEPVKLKSRSKEATSGLKIQDGKSSSRENKIDNAQNSPEIANAAPVAKYGSERNPKLLTAWFPVVIFDGDGDKKCHLIFEGKLLNEAGHVTNRKFVTDEVRRRSSPKVIETISHEFYSLVGDLNDRKHVVPKELIKLCYSGCPGRIGNFCEKWKASIGDIYKTPQRTRLHNTSVDCLSVPTSSRGRRILPPLNYWEGERVVTKDNRTMYSPGNSQESSIHSSLENTIPEVKRTKYSPKARTDATRTNESKDTDTKKKNVERISPPSVGGPTTEGPSQTGRGSQKIRSVKRRMAKRMQDSSSESEDSAESKAAARKRKTKSNENVVNKNIVPTKKLRNSSQTSVSPQSPEHANISPKKKSFANPSNTEVKSRFRKRPKIDENQAILQQSASRTPTEIKCTFYTNLPMHDGDLSEDQLSTM